MTKKFHPSILSTSRELFIYSMFETNLLYPTLSMPDSEIAGAKINLPVGTPEWKFTLILILILNFNVLFKKSKVLVIVL